jgi:hypothetical protein
MRGKMGVTRKKTPTMPATFESPISPPHPCSARNLRMRKARVVLPRPDDQSAGRSGEKPEDLGVETFCTHF